VAFFVKSELGNVCNTVSDRPYHSQQIGRPTINMQFYYSWDE